MQLLKKFGKAEKMILVIKKLEHLPSTQAEVKAISDNSTRGKASTWSLGTFMFPLLSFFYRKLPLVTNVLIKMGNFKVLSSCKFTVQEVMNQPANQPN